MYKVSNAPYITLAGEKMWEAVVQFCKRAWFVPREAASTGFGGSVMGFEGLTKRLKSRQKSKPDLETKIYG